MITLKVRYVFHLVGAIIVFLWIFLVAHLYKHIHANHNKKPVNITSAEDSWFEIFFKNKKIGYLANTIIPTKTGYTVKEDLFIKITFLGYLQDLSMSIRYDTNRKFQLRKFNLSLIADKLRFHISGMVKGKELIIKRKSGGKKFQYRIYLHNPPVIGISIFPFIRSKRICVGDVFFIPFLDPTTMSQQKIKVKIVNREKIKIKKMYYDAYRLETEVWGNPVIIWVDSCGMVLKQEGLMGLVMIRSNAQDAMANIVGPELYNIVSIKANKEIPEPEKISYLKVRINGGGYENKILEIKKSTFPDSSSYEIPYRKDDLYDYLRPELNIESDSDLIISKAKEIAGKEKDPIKVAKKIVNWVYKHIEKKMVLSFPSSLETLKSRVGDCNEHAVLVAALLRSVGIPARICVGLIYNNGRFFYHAWNEVYVGKWVSVDATLNQMPADATHILLFYGNIEKQVQIIRMLGNLSIDILDFSYDKADKSHKKI